MNAASSPGSTRERLLLTAERLCATEGIESVSLRQIAREAGQKNVGAMQYHFGDRQGLFEAILKYRMAAVDVYRRKLLEKVDAAGRGDDVRELVRCLGEPYLQHIRREGNGSHYVEFLARFQVSYPDLLQTINYHKPWQQCAREIGIRLERLMGDMPKRFRRQRMDYMAASMIQGASEFERTVRSGRASMDDLPPFTANLVDALVGLLTAPVSDESRKLLAGRE